MKKRRRNPDISPEAWELVLFGENSQDHWIRNQFDSIVKNITRRVNKGTYDASKAPALWKYWFDSIAKQYTKEHDTGGGYGIFTATIRREAAAYYAPLMHADIVAGEYDHLMKLKRNPMGRRTVTRKKTRSAAQIRATKKMIAAARSRRTKKKVRRKNPALGNTIRGNYLTARADPRQVRTRTPVHTGRRINPINHYGIKSGGRWFNGRGWTTAKNNAAMWKTLATARDVAQTLSDHTNKSVTVHSM